MSWNILEIARWVGFFGIGVVAVLVPVSKDHAPRMGTLEYLYIRLKEKGL